MQNNMLNRFYSLVFISVIIILFSSCKKDPVTNQLEQDIKTIEKHLEENHIDATKHESGLFYSILNAGGAEKPRSNSTVTVNYRGTLLNGTSFDSGEYFSSRLDYLIKGWQIGIPLIGNGGRIILYVPSTLGYGNRPAGSIPPNSVLVFDVTLHYFSN